MTQPHSNQHLKPRIIMFLLGIFLMTFGISLSCKADLGTSPISSVPWVLSMFLPQTVGGFTIIMNLILILLQPIILRALYIRELIGQFITTLFFGTGIDFSMHLLDWFTPDNTTEKWIACLLSIVILALGIFLEVNANIFLVAGEGVVKVISFVSGKKFSFIKNCFDITLVVISIAISFCEFHGLRGIGLGTIAAAILVGRMVYIYEKNLHFVKKWKAES